MSQSEVRVNCGYQGREGNESPPLKPAACCAGVGEFHGPWQLFLPKSMQHSGWLAGRDGLQRGDGGGDVAGPAVRVKSNET
jgi:hypothetical protein